MPANATHMSQSSGSGLLTLKCNRFLISLQAAFLEFFPMKYSIRIGHIWEASLKYSVTLGVNILGA